MTISMNKIILHQHLEKRLRSNPRDDLVEGMWIGLVVGDGFALDEGLDQDGVF
jgi:hypothetical protein